MKRALELTTTTAAAPAPAPTLPSPSTGPKTFFCFGDLLVELRAEFYAFLPAITRQALACTSKKFALEVHAYEEHVVRSEFKALERDMAAYDGSGKPFNICIFERLARELRVSPLGVLMRARSPAYGTIAEHGAFLRWFAHKMNDHPAIGLFGIFFYQRFARSVARATHVTELAGETHFDLAICFAACSFCQIWQSVFFARVWLRYQEEKTAGVAMPESMPSGALADLPPDPIADTLHSVDDVFDLHDELDGGKYLEYRARLKEEEEEGEEGEEDEEEEEVCSKTDIEELLEDAGMFPEQADAPNKLLPFLPYCFFDLEAVFEECKNLADYDEDDAALDDARIDILLECLPSVPAATLAAFSTHSVQICDIVTAELFGWLEYGHGHYSAIPRLEDATPPAPPTVYTREWLMLSVDPNANLGTTCMRINVLPFLLCTPLRMAAYYTARLAASNDEETDGALLFKAAFGEEAAAVRNLPLCAKDVASRVINDHHIELLFDATPFTPEWHRFATCSRDSFEWRAFVEPVMHWAVRERMPRKTIREDIHSLPSELLVNGLDSFFPYIRYAFGDDIGQFCAPGSLAKDRYGQPRRNYADAPFAQLCEVIRAKYNALCVEYNLPAPF